MDHLKPIRPPQEWTVDFKVTFKSDMFPGFGYDPMDIVKALKKDLENGSVGHYVKSAYWSIDWFSDEEVNKRSLRDNFRMTNDVKDYLRS